MSKVCSSTYSLTAIFHVKVDWLIFLLFSSFTSGHSLLLANFIPVIIVKEIKAKM